jgi:hypothetical protein
MAAAASLALLATSANAANTIFDDTFDSGTGAWYTGGSVGELTSSSQQLSWNITNTTTVNGMRQVIGRSFPTQSIAVGESIEFTFDYTRTAGSLGILRAGLFNLTDPIAANDWANAATNAWSGYYTFIRSSTSNLARVHSQPGMAVPGAGSGGAATPLNGPTFVGADMTVTAGGSTYNTVALNTQYQGSFLVTRTETGIETLFKLSQGATELYSVAANTTTTFADFNTAAIRVSEGTVIFDNMKVRVSRLVSEAPRLTITSALAPATGYDLAWNSKAGKLYNLRTSTSLDGPISGWDILRANITATPPANLVNVQADGPRRFYAVEAFDAPPLLEQNFEEVGGPGPPEGWTRTDNSAGTVWEVGTPAGGAQFVPNAAAEGTRCAGTNINAQYTANAEASLISPAFTVPESGAALSYWQYIDTESAPSGDLGSIRVLNAADNSFLANVVTNIEGTTPTWSQQSIDLPAAANGREVKLEFRFTSNAEGNWGGFYIDDVAVTAK